MTANPDERDRERLRAENATLNEQVKLLVRTEQRLYRSQGELDSQLGRVRELARFALESARDESASGILGRALELLDRTFRIDWAGIYVLDPRGRGITLVHALAGPLQPGLPRLVGEGARTWLDAMNAPEFVSGACRPPGDVTWDFARAVAPDSGLTDPVTELEIAVIPLKTLGDGAPGVIVQLARRRPAVFFRDTIVSERHLPFLQLIAQHADRAFQNVRLTESLRDRSAQLASSLRTLEITQHQLLQAQKMEAVGRLAGGVAHDFNNLLTVILGYAGALESALPPGAPEQEDLRRILDAGRSAAAITSQLLALGRRQLQRLEHVDLGAEVGRTVDLLRLLVREDTRIELVLDRALRPVHVDRSQLEQVMLNLVVNARDAIPGGGMLRIATRAATAVDAARCDAACDPAEFAVLEVEDSGQGMDEATRTRVFEPFFTTKGAGKGSGLGLAVVYGIVKQSAGHIFVDSEPGRGANFRVLLPFSAPGSVVEPPPERRAPGTRATGFERVGAGRIILVAEDEVQIREVITLALQSSGYVVFAVENGAEALEWIDTHGVEPDLLLTDVVMPVMGGLALEQELLRRWPGVQVAFMSGYAEDLNVGDGRRAFLAKPFTPGDLLAFVAAHLQPGPALAE